jgi:hypothetical protein
VKSVASGNRRPRDRGQALVETLVFALALVPLLLGLVFVTKYQSIRQAAVASSRSVAFDCTVRPETCGDAADAAALHAEAWQRHLADTRTILQSVGAPGTEALVGNPFWVDRTPAPLIEGRESVRVDVTREPADATAKADAAAMGLPAHVGLRLGDDLVRADVRAQVSSGWRLGDWLLRPRGIELALAGRTAILVDAWNASEGRGDAPRSVETRVARGSVPPLPGFEAAVDAGYLPIRSLIRSPLLAPFEPNGQHFRYHEWDVEQVPEDRLVGAGR